MGTPYSQMIAGTQELVTTLACLAVGGVIKPLTPLMLGSTGLLSPWDGTAPGKAVYLTPGHPIDSATQRRALVYKAGIFNIDEVNWPETVTTTELKMAAFVGSGISVQPLRN